MDEIAQLKREIEFKTNELGKYILRAANAEGLLSDIAAIIDNDDGVLSPFDGKPDLLASLRSFKGGEEGGEAPKADASSWQQADHSQRFFEPK